MSAGSLRHGLSNGKDVEEKEYAFEMASSNIRYGEGVTKEVGIDVLNLGIKHLCVFTDKNVSRSFTIACKLYDSLHCTIPVV